MMKQCWTKPGAEPAIWDVLADPIVQSLMKADRVTRRDVLDATQLTNDRLQREDETVALG